MSAKYEFLHGLPGWPAMVSTNDEDAINEAKDRAYEMWHHCNLWDGPAKYQVRERQTGRIVHNGEYTLEMSASSPLRNETLSGVEC